MKNTNEEIYQIIKEIIDEWDPVGLLRIGAPNDEYEPEIKRLVNQFSDINHVEELSIYIYDLFLKMFGDNINTKAQERYECDKIAKKIFERINQ